MTIGRLWQRITIQDGIAALAAIVLVAALCQACSQAPRTGGQRAVDIAGLPVCAWPAELDRADGGIGACFAARAYLSCEGYNGGGELCLSNDVTRCPPLTAASGTTFSNCQNQCDAGEYAVACGGPGPGPWPPPPAGCRTLPPGPGGGTISCCRCLEPLQADAAAVATGTDAPSPLNTSVP